ncbi:hypothetical protein BSK59_15540 [Paenibacillus odorifer]|uniref:hypothetical protein n=1 Tax=Paenibacillus odorifer TaxID=189426 RepID=UPI00096D9E05|nr:hypothetical protein [Paenibacillus odorifer]OME53992.1 hypothetical protein BSK59_15540 [Paenibacillus odorifer]
MELRSVLIGEISNTVYNALEKCAVRSEILYTDQFIRGIGKTTALVKLAKKFDLYIVVPSIAHIQLYDHDKVVGQNQLDNLVGKKDVCLIFDEGVDLSKLDGFNVITGIVNNF